MMLLKEKKKEKNSRGLAGDEEMLKVWGWKKKQWGSRPVGVGRPRLTVGEHTRSESRASRQQWQWRYACLVLYDTVVLSKCRTETSNLNLTFGQL